MKNPQVLVNVGAQERLLSLFENLGTQGAVLFEQMLSTLRNALSSALAEVFAVIFGAVVFGLIVNLFLKGIPKHKNPPD